MEEYTPLARKMGDTGQPPPPSIHGDVGKSWASVLSRGLTPSCDNNVLEVVLDKESKGAFSVSDIDCCNLIRRLGLDQRPGVQVQGVQICPNGRGVIYITLRKEIEIGKYCRYDVLDVTSSGVRAVLVKPAGKRVAVVTLKGIHPNTSDRTVIDYLAKFGSVVTTKVVYGVFPGGPLQGLRNGDRSYKMEIKPSTSIDSYHVLDGQRVSLRYPGQQQTCARCLQTAQLCRGRGVAKKCEAEGGEKADFSSYIQELWDKIGYTPEVEALDNEDGSIEKDSIAEVDVEFTPQKPMTSPEKFTGVVVKNIPKDRDHGEIVEFLILCGLPEERKEDISIGRNGSVTISNLENKLCLDLIKSIHFKEQFGRKIYCNGYVPLTPEKEDHVEPVSTLQTVDPISEGPAEPAHQTQSSLSGLPPTVSLTASSQISYQPVNNTSPTPLPEILTPRVIDWYEETNENLVRRYSLSLTDRTPPKSSLAADILGTAQLEVNHGITKKSLTLMNSLKDIQDVLTDFNSCNSTLDSLSSSSEESSDLKNQTNKSPSRRKRKKKPRSDLVRGDFLKKQDTKPSPK